MLQSLYRSIFLCLCAIALLIPIQSTAKPAEINAKDVQIVIANILERHALYNDLSPEIMQRSLCVFIETLDPGKTYFLEHEVHPYLFPSPDFSKEVLNDFLHEDYGVFQDLFNKMSSNIERLHKIKEDLKVNPITFLTPPTVKSLENISFAQTEKELKERVATYNALFLNLVDNLSAEDQELVFKSREKREKNKEADYLTQDLQQKQHLLYTLILQSLSSSLDTHTAYFTPSEASRFVNDVQRSLFGIGIRFRDRFNGFSVEEILPGGPAQKQGLLQVNDKIVAVNGVPIIGLDAIEAADMITGQENTEVTLTIEREDGASKQAAPKRFNLTMVRKKIVVEESRIESENYPYQDGCILHIHLKSFYMDESATSGSDIAKYIQQIAKEKKIYGIILDLRSNSGGLVSSSIEVSGLFLDKGIIVAVKNQEGSTSYLPNLNTRKIWDGPLIVLTNIISCSASEIVTQCLQDYGRAIIVGDTHTYGKGSYQSPSMGLTGTGKINPKGEFKVTEGLYYTVSGKSPQLTGVSADIVVPGPYSELELGERFAKYPLPNSSICSSFDYQFKDVPPLPRARLLYAMRGTTQQKIATYTQLIPQLQQLSKERLEANQDYQAFLAKIKKINSDSSFESDPEGKNDNKEKPKDLQLEESINVMRDIILLSPQK